MIKVELHVCNHPKDTADLYYDRHSTINNNVAFIIDSNQVIINVGVKYMIFCTVGQLEKYCHGYEFNVIVYHDRTIAKVTDSMFAMLLNRERL